MFLLWAATLTMPSLDSVEQRRVEQSTKIYDNTGKILLYDLHQDIKRTVIGFDEMSQYIKDATVAIEDEEFYEHYGIKPTAIMRAVWANVVSGGFVQGGSTITQQVVKNSVLVSDKTISRKFKEWILAIRLERERTKDEILELYLNETPYGGNKYGIEEASRAFFDKKASELTLAEAAYLAALPQAPTYFSPYGNHRDDLEARKNKVLSKMLEHGFINKEQYKEAKSEEVTFQPQRDTGIEAPHFVFYVIDELREVYSEREIQEGGLRVITSLDYDLQSQAEEIVNRYALENEEKFNASNASLVAIDPKTGGILTMVGSRDYFDETIDGNFNIALAHRQPGSSFKPFVYAAAIEKGYTPETIVFDVRTQFSTACDPTDLTSEEGCYSPGNYDNVFRGPMTFRQALAQSTNIPAVKALYLAGLPNSLDLAKRMGVRSLTNPDQYGLTLVLGGGEVTLLEMVSSYGVFASDGIRREHSSLVRIEDRDGEVLKSFDTTLGRKVIDENVARAINDILSDNVARTPAFGSRSHLYFPGRQVAAKTGTTNEYRDAWILGYTPEIVAGAWAGNNDNTPMDKKVAGFIIAPLWNEFMQAAFDKISTTTPFAAYEPPVQTTLKPVLRGLWQGDTFVIDTVTGKLATENTPLEFRKEVSTGNIHSILHWVDRNDPAGPAPTNPGRDGQYKYWEYGITLWKVGNGYGISTTSSSTAPIGVDDVHTPENSPEVTIRRPRTNDRYEPDESVRVRLTIEEKEYDIKKADYFVNGEFIGSTNRKPFSYTFTPEDITSIKESNALHVIVYDEVLNRGSATTYFRVE